MSIDVGDDDRGGIRESTRPCTFLAINMGNNRNGSGNGRDSDCSISRSFRCITDNLAGFSTLVPGNVFKVCQRIKVREGSNGDAGDAPKLALVGPRSPQEGFFIEQHFLHSIRANVYTMAAVALRCRNLMPLKSAAARRRGGIGGGGANRTAAANSRTQIGPQLMKSTEISQYW